MYEEYFGLSGAPFKLSPDPKFFFGSRSHNKAMAYLHYGLKQAEGFIVITGPVGAGKSMIISHLLDQLNRSNVVAAHLLTSNVEPDELLAHILSAFRIAPEGEGRSGQLEAFEDYLFDQLNRGRRVLLILDEAQNLPRNTLEELRMLSNIDYDGTPLFQVFLVGQPEFRETMAADNMEQLKQRVIASYHLEELSRDETKEYIHHRLSVVGWKKDPVFNDEAFDLIHAETKGRPRRINTVCNRIMLYCSLEKRHDVDASVVKAVLAELAEEKLQSAPSKEKKPSKRMPAPKAVESKPEPKSEKAEDDVIVPFQAPQNAAPKEEETKANTKPAVKKSSEGEKKSASAGKGKDDENPGNSDVAKIQKRADEDAPAPAKPAKISMSTSMSVLDRVRAQREAPTAVKQVRQEASLSDVASAIAAASDGATSDSADDIGEPESQVTLDAPAVAADPSGWRKSVSRSINDTRDELKEAHANVVRLRRKLSDIQRRRDDSRAEVVASLSRAETLLGELRDAWR